MLIEEIIVIEAKQVWARRGGKLKRMYRCQSGPRRGRVVASPAQCHAPIDLDKRRTMKKTRARLAPRMARKARRTRRIDPVSRRLRLLNNEAPTNDTE